MSSEHIGSLIRQLRKERHLTQKELAAQLNVTDKAVSKWERDVSLPDVALLLPLAEILGISLTELLAGRRDTDAPPPDPAGDILSYAQRTAPQWRERLRLWLFTGLSGAFLLAAAVCWICDTALNGKLSWSLLVCCSLALAWVVLLPLLTVRQRAVMWALAVLSAAILPYLYLLGMLLKNPRVFQFGLPIAPAAAAYLWAVLGAVRRLRRRPWLAGGAVLGLTSALSLYINAVTRTLICGPAAYGDSLLSLALAAGCLLADHMSRGKSEETL